MMTLKEIWEQSKPRRLIRMVMDSSTVGVKPKKGETEEFEINRSVRNSVQFGTGVYD